MTSRFWFVPRYMFRRAHRSDTRDTPALFFLVRLEPVASSCGPMLFLWLFLWQHHSDVIANIDHRRAWSVSGVARGMFGITPVRSYFVRYRFTVRLSACLVKAFRGTVQRCLITTALTCVGPQTSFSPAWFGLSLQSENVHDQEIVNCGPCREAEEMDLACMSLVPRWRSDPWTKVCERILRGSQKAVRQETSGSASSGADREVCAR